MRQTARIYFLTIAVILFSSIASANATGGLIGDLFIQNPDGSWRLSQVSSITSDCSTGQVLVQKSGQMSCQSPDCIAPPFGTVLNGSGVTAYQYSSVPFGSSCESFTEIRQCNFGVLGGTYENAACSTQAPAACSGTAWGDILHGSGVIGYSNQTAVYPQTCQSETRVCYNGTLSGSYLWTDCTQQYTYSWETGAYSSCSATCGGGTQTRAVVCKRNDGIGTTVDDSFCDSVNKPLTNQDCNTQVCMDPLEQYLSGIVVVVDEAPGQDGATYKAGYYYNYSLPPEGIQEGFVAKINADSSVGWVKTIGGNRYDLGLTITMGSGYLYAGGLFVNGAVDIDSTKDFKGQVLLGKDKNGWHSADCFLAKLDLNGNQQWIKTYEDIGDGFGNSLYKDDAIYDLSMSNGVLVATGFVNDMWGGPVTGEFVINVNPVNGDRILGLTYSWITGAYGSCSVACGGGTQTRTVVCQRSDSTIVDDSYCTGTKPALSQSCNTQTCIDGALVSSIFSGAVLASQASDESGNTYIIGTYKNYARPVEGQDDAYLMKVNASGSVAWTKTLGGGRYDFGHVVIYTGGYLYAGGLFVNGAVDIDGVKDFNGQVLLGKDVNGWHSADCFVSKLDTSGNQQWIKTYENIGDGFGNSLWKDDWTSSLSFSGSSLVAVIGYADEWTGANPGTTTITLNPGDGTRY